MNYTTLSSWGPNKIPSTIKYLIIITTLFAILSSGAQSLFEQFNLFPGPQNLFSLSWWGIYKGYLWQFLTFLFIQDSSGGLSFFFFINLLFNMYLLWMIGSSVYQVIGKWSFLRLYLIGGMVAGALALLSMKITGQYEMLSGLTASLLIIFVVWSMAFPETEILFFFLLPVKVKWIAVGLLGILLLISLSHWDLSHFILYLSAGIIGYVYCVSVHGWYSPFSLTLSFDVWLSRVAAMVRKKILFFKKSDSSGKSSKAVKASIIDINTEQAFKNDDAFVDAMLTKISQKGENSLSWSEKKRLEEISKKKMKDNQRL